MKPKRCSKCNKMIRQENKSGLCHYHNQQESRMRKKRESCTICQEKCSGKMLIEVKKNSYASFCTYHFNKLMEIKDMKEVRKTIKRLKSYH